MRLIVGASGTLFDPQIVQVFEDDFQNILKVKKTIEKT